MDGNKEKAVVFFVNCGLEEETVTFAWKQDEYSTAGDYKEKPWGDAKVVSADQHTVTVRLAGNSCLALEMAMNQDR